MSGTLARGEAGVSARSPRVVRWLRSRLAPFPKETSGPAPRLLLRFIVDALRPALPWLALLLSLALLTALSEVMLVGLIGRVLDGLGKPDEAASTTLIAAGFSLLVAIPLLRAAAEFLCDLYSRT